MAFGDVLAPCMAVHPHLARHLAPVTNVVECGDVVASTGRPSLGLESVGRGLLVIGSAYDNTTVGGVPQRRAVAGQVPADELENSFGGLDLGLLNLNLVVFLRKKQK